MMLPCIPSTPPTGSVLPESFHPGINEVIIGRGKRIAEHCGNKRLHAIVRTFVKEYSAAPTKRQKSAILTKVVLIIRNSSAHQAGFVKQDTLKGGWCIVEDAAARITVAQAFRDALHINYKSSKQFKQQKRQEKQGGHGYINRSASFSSTNQESPLMALSGATGSTLMALTDPVAPVCESSSSISKMKSGLKITFQGTGSPASSGIEEGFSNLFRLLEAGIDLSKDPFEPTPIPETTPSSSSYIAPPLRSPVNSVPSSSSFPQAQLVDDIGSVKLAPSSIFADFDVCMEEMEV